MEKIIKIGNKDVAFKSSAAIPPMYRRKFNKDIFLDIGALENAITKKSSTALTVGVEALEIFEHLTWCFAKHADPGIPDDPEEWFAEFELMDIYNIIPEIIDMWTGDRVATSKLKKKEGGQTGT